jgi:hypothetical protein
MSHTTLDNPAPAPAKAGVLASHATVAGVRRVRVPRPPPLTDDDRELIRLMLDAASDTTSRVTIVLVEVDGFAVVDAAAVVGIPPRLAADLIRSSRSIAADRFAAECRAARLRLTTDREVHKKHKPKKFWRKGVS